MKLIGLSGRGSATVKLSESIGIVALRHDGVNAGKRLSGAPVARAVPANHAIARIL
jgi:hypothetical protein